MANRIPLIVNSTANQIQELPTNDNLQLNDTNELRIGTGGDFVLSHNGSDSFINLNLGSLNCVVKDAAGEGFYVKDPNSGSEQYIAKFEKNSSGGAGRCELMYGGNKKFETTATGVTITGDQHIAGALTVTGDITAFHSSDKRLKDNITPIPNAVDKVLSISGNTFNWNAASEYEGKGDTGVIAQEIEALDLPGVTTTRDDGTKAVRYEKLVPLLIEAIKELKSEVDNLKVSEG
tara:strand:+ start:407 stop:1108 length:702 start_codon:yes stop_codon:yes gene_type:complete